jgi:hypothetical protein
VGRAAAFVRYAGADGAGHLGWAFDAGTAVDAGSVENPSGLPTAPPPDMGFWSDAAPSPIADMVERAYNALKYVDLTTADSASAEQTVAWVAQQWYCVFGRNCMDDVYDVLRAYGVPNLPPPVDHWLPNDWFTAFAATDAPLAGFVWPAPAPAIAAPAIAKPAPVAVQPPWRHEGTPEWRDLQRQKAEYSLRPAVRAMAARTSEVS